MKESEGMPLIYERNGCNCVQEKGGKEIAESFN